MEILDIDQLSDEWFQARIGSIGGSSISSVVAGGQGKMRKNLMYRLAGEILSGQKYESYSNPHMERGIEQEKDARSMYEFITGKEVKTIGLVKGQGFLTSDEGNHIYGIGLISNYKHYSPDGLVEEDGIIEIKCVIPSVHIETICMDRIPPEYVKQIQWGLHICQRKWCDFISYSPLVVDKPIWIKRMYRDEKIIKELDEEADRFIGEMFLIIKKVKGI